MKKTLIVALCCITVLMAACKKEKPYEKFVGSYKGEAIADVTISLAGGMFEQNIDNLAIPMDIYLSKGQADNQVILTYTNDQINESYTTIGTIEENFVDFEPITTTVSVEGNSVEVTLDMEGNLVETILSLTGTMKGSGTLPMEDNVPLPFTADGTMKAHLEKVIISEE